MPRYLEWGKSVIFVRNTILGDTEHQETEMGHYVWLGNFRATAKTNAPDFPSPIVGHFPLRLKWVHVF